MTGAKGDVVEALQLREEGMVLNHHGRAAARRSQVIDRLLAKHKLAIRNPFMAGDHAQRGALSTAAWPQETAIRPVGNGQLDGIGCHDQSVTLRHPHERKVGRLNHRSVLLQHIGAVATPGLTIFPNAEARAAQLSTPK